MRKPDKKFRQTLVLLNNKSFIFALLIVCFTNSHVAAAYTRKEVEESSFAYIDCVGDLSHSNDSKIRDIVQSSLNEFGGSLQEQAIRDGLENVYQYSVANCATERGRLVNYVNGSNYPDKEKVMSIVEKSARELFLSNVAIVADLMRKSIAQRK